MVQRDSEKWASFKSWNNKEDSYLKFCPITLAFQNTSHRKHILPNTIHKSSTSGKQQELQQQISGETLNETLKRSLAASRRHLQRTLSSGIFGAHKSSLLLHSPKRYYSSLMASGAAARDKPHSAPSPPVRGASPDQPEVGAAAASSQRPPTGLTDGAGATRRHALLEQSLERDAALSLCPAQKDSSSKWRRTASIKSALKQASLVGRPERRADTGLSAASSGGARLKQFQPPVSERALQRSMRRGAMSNDPRRQLSDDVLGIRQLTNEYLQNAGVISPGGAGLATLDPRPPSPPPAPHPANDEPALGSSLPGLDRSKATGGARSQREAADKNMAAKLPPTLASIEQINSGQSPPLETGAPASVQTHPGHMPWQSDVSVQCELVPAPKLRDPPLPVGETPCETTGDLLRTLAGPYPLLHLAQSHSGTSFDSFTTNQLSASLKRGLSVLSAANPQHHLSPSAGAAIQVVGSSIKKSISSTLDIGRMATGGCLHSQDSLPAYSSLRNEDEDDEDSEIDGGTQRQQVSLKKSARNTGTNVSNKSSAPALNCHQSEQVADNSLLGQLTSKLVRQSSCKLSVGKRGLQRALSFDCRGYKRLDKQQQQQQQSFQQHLTVPAPNQGVASNTDAHKRHRMQNKSLLSLNSSGRRPYQEQLASKVDFQLPLLPYHKMQEAIVAQRLIEPAAGVQHQYQQKDSYQQQQQSKVASTAAIADELICAKAPDTLESPLIPEMSDAVASTRQPQPQQKPAFSTSETSTSGSSNLGQEATGSFVAKPSGRQTLSIPIIAHESTRQEELHPLIQYQGVSEPSTTARHQDRAANRQLRKGAEGEPLADDEVAGPLEQTAHNNAKTGVIVCLPSPSVVPDKTFELFATAGSTQASLGGGSSSTLKPSSSATLALGPTQRNRRSAIVPPKMVTDSESPTETRVATSRLIDLGDDDQQRNDDARKRSRDEEVYLSADEAAASGRAARIGARPQHLAIRRRSISEHQITDLPTFYIEPNESSSKLQSELDSHQPLEQQLKRPDSQMTQADSIISSGSSGNLSNLGRKDFTLASPCNSLKVNLGPAINRRRSSIAVIPQMQICPGDLLVYSKQLIDRMNQPPEEQDQPRFLSIDDKKAKNIWSSFKLFDNRTVRAREELLNSLEDVLASLQPSTFVDEQLSHFKGMAWNEFLYETESRRSASSERDILCLEGGQVKEIGVGLVSTTNGSATKPQHSNLDTLSNLRRTINTPSREPLKATMSSSATATASASACSAAASRIASSEYPNDYSSRDGTKVRPVLREKPKLRRGQTVDSVFRIPLVPSSPLKHAQQHQQTPTAHLEELELITIEDNESATSSMASFRMGRSSIKRNKSSSSSSRPADVHRARSNAPHSDRAQETGEHTLEDDGCGEQSKQFELSSFETDDALDIILQVEGQQHGHGPNQMDRQSSLSTLSSIITRTEQKRQRALWDLFQSECTFFFDHLLTLKNVYMEPLKKIQVEGFAMFADPDTLFGNLDELCCGVYDFCKEFLLIIMRTLKTRPEELNATDVLIKLYKRNPKIDHLRGVYHRYTLNYINALTYLESLRKQVEFVEFEKWSSRDVRCKKLQLTDLLVAPVQHIMRVPIILKDIESHTENSEDRDEIRAILAVEEASLRELDDKMRWLKNFERLLEIQKSISWPSVLELDSKIFVPESLKENLAKQPCERLIVSPRRQIIYEGTLSSLDTGKPSDMHVILFDDMLLLTRRKKALTKRTSNVCKTNTSSSTTKDEALIKYMVYKQPLSLDRFYVQDVQPIDAQSSGYKHMFLLIVTNRYQQIVGVHSFMASNEDIKQTWLFKIKKTCERWKRNFSTEQQNGHQQADGAHVTNHKNKHDTNNHDEIYTPKVVDLEHAMRQPITIEQPHSIRSQNLALGLRANAASAVSPKPEDPKGEPSITENDTNNNTEQNPETELVVMSTEDNKESSSYQTCNAVYTDPAH